MSLFEIAAESAAPENNSVGVVHCRACDITFAIPLQSLYMSNHPMGGHSVRAHEPAFCEIACDADIDV